jgi:predicted RNA binding protein YcfA (HicA-like mRNA interferase family)
MGSTSNIALKDFIKFIEDEGMKLIRTTGGHFIYSRSDLARSMALQTHISPVPEFIVFQFLKALDMSSDKMFEKMGKTKGTSERKAKVAKRGKRS